MILIISTHKDLHARHIVNLIRSRNIPAAILDLAELPETTLYSHHFGTPDAAKITQSECSPIELSEVTAIWFRRPSTITVGDNVIDPVARQFIRNEWSEALNGSVLSYPDARWVNHPLAQITATKTLQLNCAEDVGLRIPRTLVSNDPNEVRNFLRHGDRPIIHKSITTPQNRLIDTRNWDAGADEVLDECLPLAPAIFQERIDGPADLRITLVGDTCFAARIETGQSRAKLDSRLDPDAAFAPFDLPAETREQLNALMNTLDLSFGVIDMKVNDAGELVFLELNPQGQFLFVEILTGLKISDALVRHLCA